MDASLSEVVLSPSLKYVVAHPVLKKPSSSSNIWTIIDRSLMFPFWIVAAAEGSVANGLPEPIPVDFSFGCGTEIVFITFVDDFW